MDIDLNSVDLTQLASTKMAKSEVKMKTLCIQSIFSNFSFYQQNYLQIIQNPEQYYIAVENACVNTFPFRQQVLFLGDLLQLWFGHKWKIQNPNNLLIQAKYIECKWKLSFICISTGWRIISGCKYRIGLVRCRAKNCVHTGKKYLAICGS